jgi:aquaporin Z
MAIKNNNKLHMKKYIAETIGTFAMIFCGTGAIIVNTETGGAISHAGIAAVWGLIVAAMIYTLGDISGAHFNPAVTLSFWLAKSFPVKEILPYILSQLIGAFSASFILHVLFPYDLLLGSTLPSGSAFQSFVLEFILTFLLLFTILHVAKGSKEQGLFAGLAIGSVVLLEAMFAGPICGASMNPIRSLSPAIVSGNIEFIWIYLTAPFLGAFSSVLVWKAMKKN